jgi:hypothetical protein
MADPIPNDNTTAVTKQLYQEVLDLLIFLSDEMEMGRLPCRGDGVGALRMAAGLVALTRELT